MDYSIEVGTKMCEHEWWLIVPQVIRIPGTIDYECIKCNELKTVPIEVDYSKWFGIYGQIQ